jgi:exopolysaccharide production protein ExoZ
METGSTKTAPDSKTLLSIQALRAVAAMLVVAFHATVLWHDHAPDQALVWENGNAGVDLFFVISGLVIVLSSSSLVQKADGWRTFVVQRLIRVVPMYWLTTTGKLIAITLAPALALHSFPTVWNVIASYLFIPAANANGEIVPVLVVGWTLSFEMLFYAAFTAALVVRLDPLRVVVPAMVCVAIASLFRTPEWPAASTVINPMVLEFVLGALIARVYLSFPTRLSPGPLMLVLGLAGAATLIFLPIGTVWERAIFWGSGAGAVVAAAVAFEPIIRRHLPVLLVQLGEASYSLYLTHAFVLPVVGLVVTHLVHGAGWRGPVLVGSCLVVIAAASLVVYRLVEKPMTNWLRHSAGPPQKSRVLLPAAPRVAR